MDSWKKIRDDMTQELIAAIRTSAETSADITYIDPRSNIVGLLTPVAKGMQRALFEMERKKRSLELMTAEGADLNTIGEGRGVNRLGANKAGVVIALYGSNGAQLAANSVLRATNGMLFTTQNTGTLTLGTSDSEIREPSLMVRTTAVAQVPGLGGNVPSFTINRIVSGATGTISVTNHLPSSGGAEVEGDAEYRMRIMRSNGLLNHRTRDKYTTLAQQANSAVLRAWVGRGNGGNEVSVRVVNRATNATFSSSDLQAIQNFIEDYVFPDHPVVSALSFTDFYVEVVLTKAAGYTLQAIHKEIVNRMLHYVNPSLWPFGLAVRDDVLFSIAANATGVRNMDRGGFRIFSGGNEIQGDVPVALNSLPRLLHIKVTDETAASYGASPDFVQSFVAPPEVERPYA